MISGAYERHSSELSSLLATNPDLVKGVEVASGRQVDGKDTFYKLIATEADLAVGSQGIAHGISTIARVVHMYGVAERDSAGGQDVTFANTDLASNGINFLAVNETTVIISVATGFTGAGNTLSKLRIFLEYSKE